MYVHVYHLFPQEGTDDSAVANFRKEFGGEKFKRYLAKRFYPAQIEEIWKHLFVWAQHYAFEKDTDRDNEISIQPNVIEASDIDDLGTWSRSPQGNDFWSPLNSATPLDEINITSNAQLQERETIEELLRKNRHLLVYKQLSDYEGSIYNP